MGHHGGRGTMAAAMVHRVLLIDMCLVLDVYIGMVLTYRRSTLLLDNWDQSPFLILIAWHLQRRLPSPTMINFSGNN